MSISKEQLARVTVVCKCGCGESFSAFPVYKNKSEGGGLRIPEYKRGHHPNCRKKQLSGDPWNKGLRKETNPSVAKQGVRGVDHFNYDPEQNPDWFSKDFDFRAFSEKFGTKLRSKGGNKAYAKFRKAILKRDNYTCQHCGISDDIGFDEDSFLQVHHIVYIKHDRTRIFDPTNVVTLCFNCHWITHKRK